MDPASKKPRATYQDVLNAPERQIAEVINGEMHLSPRPAGPHTSVMGLLGAKLITSFGGGGGSPGGWTILPEPELHLGENVVVPDLAGWRDERLPVLAVPHFTVVPDWICEVLSRSTERLDRAEKQPLFAAAGVRWFWLLHPMRRTLEVFRLHEGKWLTIATLKDDDRGRLEPFVELELELATLWRKLPLPTVASDTGVESWAD